MRRNAPLATQAQPRLASGPPSVCPLRPIRFETVYEQNVDFVWRTVRRLGVPEGVIADAVQEAFVVVHRRLADFDGRTSMRHWLAGICAHIARREYRTRRRRQPEAFCGATAVEPDTLADRTTGDPFDRLERKDSVRLVYELLATLDAEKREVFVLAEFEQMTAPQMAKVLGIPLNTVYSRLRAARLQFERALPRCQTLPRRSS